MLYRFLNANWKKEYFNSDIIIINDFGLVEDGFSITVMDSTHQSQTISKENFIEQNMGEGEA